MFKIIFALAVLTAFAYTQPVPQPWPNEFTATFEEDMYVPLRGHQNTAGNWYYSWTKKAFRVDRVNGANDRYCGPTKGFKATPCNMYVVNGKRYLHYPNLNQCCYCCGAENGCGIVKPNWYVTGTYKGRSTHNGYQIDTWDKHGSQSNLVGLVAGTNKLYQIFQQPQSNMIFNPASIGYSTPASLFNLPGDCSQTCPFLSICTAVRSGYKFTNHKDNQGGDL